MQEEIIKVDGIEYAIFNFHYISDDEYFCFLDNSYYYDQCSVGKVYVLIPSFIEMQDIYMASCEKNIQTKKMEVNNFLLKFNKIRFLCLKIVEEDGTIHWIDNETIGNLYPNFANWILRKIDNVIDKYYYGSGLSKEMENYLAYKCFLYFSAIKKREKGMNVDIPPAPGAVHLMNICELFNCTPDVARKINRRYLDLIFIAKEQENIVENHPEMIGFGLQRK